MRILNISTINSHSQEQNNLRNDFTYKKQHIENKFSGVFFTCSIKLPFITKQTTQDKPISKRICNLATFSASVDVAFWVRYAPFFIRMRIGLCIGMRIGLYIVLRTTQERKKVAKRIRNQSRIIPKKMYKNLHWGAIIDRFTV